MQNEYKDFNMKKIIIVLIFSAYFICTQVFATVITQRKISPKTEKIVDAIKTCMPYRETLNADYMGMNMNFEMKIEGWKNNKCYLSFKAQTSGASSSFKELYGVDSGDAEVYSFAPKVRCGFTKAQLDYVGDSILQEEERYAGGAANNMLKNPNEISFSNLKESDMRLIDVVFNQGACSLENSQDLDNLMKMLY